MAINEAEQIEIISPMVRVIMGAIAAKSPNGEVTGDDVLSLHALGIALMIDNDTNLRTPRDRRLAVETAKKHVERWMRVLDAVKKETGMSALSRMLDAPDQSANLH